MLERPRILIVDDQADVRTALRMLLRTHELEATTVDAPAAALEALAAGGHDLLLADLNYTRDTTSGEEGLQLIRDVRAAGHTLPIVVMTAYGSVEVAVGAMREGAQDFVEKPWDNYRLIQVLRSQLELAAARRRERQLEGENRGLREGGRAKVIAASPPMRRVMELVGRIAPADVSVLITGENGVGKGVIARALHGASARAEAPLVTVDMGTLSDALIESELFGHEAGAFTDARGQRLGRFELADGGTLFLDEIGNVPAAQQPKLLRVIESGAFERVGSSTTRRTDVRLICATNAELAREVAEGRFREDLYYRLHTVEVTIPPLRERREDIAALAEHFLERAAQKYRRSLTGFADDARKAMARYRWPGNVRELAHAVERAALLATGERIAADDLGLGSVATQPKAADDDWTYRTLADAERVHICAVLARCRGQVSEAAGALGLSRSALYRRLERFELSVEQAVAEGSSRR